MVFKYKILSFLLVLFSINKAELLVENKDTIKRDIININEGWQYLDDVDNETQEGWQMVNLPHTWNQWDPTDNEPGYRRDASLYKKVLGMNMDPSKYTYKLYFEGVNITSNVFVNGQKAGEHVGGYVGFEMDITHLLKQGSDNEVSVMVDNSVNRDIIPSQKADFVIYGGITRDVWLKKLPKNHLNVVQVSTPKVSKNEAATEVKISSALPECGDCKYVVRIFDPNNKVVSEKEVKVTSNNIVMPTIRKPLLWSPDSPHLYTVAVSLISASGDMLDQIAEPIGYRFYHFAEHGAFYLNGERLLLRGTHRHEEHAGYGAAMTNEMHREDIYQIKELGANFLRLGHYPQDPEVYRACDEMGIIVWDELPWCRGGLGEAEWQKNTERLLTEQILQNYNHPSIFFWSLGNEIYWLPDFDNGDDTPAINVYLTKLNDLSHKLDPYRMTAIRKYYDGAKLVDVFSPSIWSGWYAGVYTNYEKTVKENMAKYPKFLHMEYGGSSHIGRHTETPITGEGLLNEDKWEEVSNQVNVKNIAQDGDWTENYIVDLFDWYLRYTESNENFPGNAQWAFKDFSTPLRPENAIPYMNQKGLVDREGKPKDAYYVFQSYWAKKPMVYIESHTWTNRVGQEGVSRDINVFSNAYQVELYHNGQSLSNKVKDKDIFPAGGLVWPVMFDEGGNSLRAIAKNKDGKIVAIDSMKVQYSYTKHGGADGIQMSSEVLPSGNVLITALAVDKEGNRVLDYERRVYFSINGKGKLLKYYGVPGKSDIVEMANGKATIEMVPGKGSATIECRNQDFKGSYLEVNLSPKISKYGNASN